MASSNHGVPWKRQECQDRAQLLEEQVDVHLKTLASSVDVVKPDPQNDSRAADYETIIDEYLDFAERLRQATISSHTIVKPFVRTCDCVETQSAELQHRHQLMGTWSSSVNQTQSPKKRKFVAEAVSYAKLNEWPLERAATVMARS